MYPNTDTLENWDSFYMEPCVADLICCDSIYYVPFILFVEFPKDYKICIEKKSGSGRNAIWKINKPIALLIILPLTPPALPFC